MNIKRPEAITKNTIIKESTKNNTSINMDNYFNNTAIVKLALRWRYHLAVIVLIAAVLGAIFSSPFFMTPLFRSEAVVYPANIDSYSDESETEQMLQLLQSQDIVDSMVRIFNLGEHYKINPEYKYYRTALFMEFRKNVKIGKTPYEAISISVRDKDPLQASQMVEQILRLYDQKVSHLHKSKYREVLDMYEKQLAYKRNLIDSLQKRMYVLGTEYGLIDFSAQSQEIMRGYLRTVYGTGSANINTAGVNELKQNIEKYGGEMLVIMEMLQHEARTFVDVKVDYELAMRFYNADMTYSNIVTHPFPSDKKVFPVRWVVVALSALGAFLLAMFVIFMLENKHIIANIQQED
jgi:capsular polysaccharide biosynthesis protein